MTKETNVDVKGDIEIRYRPAIDVEEAHDLVEIAQLLLVLRQDDGPVRVIEVGRKRLPHAERGDDTPNWGHVVAVGDDLDDLQDVLGDQTYTTATMGERHRSAARVAARGTWGLTRDASSTFLAVDVTPEIDDEQLIDQLGIVPQDSYVVTVKNPRVRSDAGLDDDERADLPDDLQAVFDGNRWAPADPVELLDHVGTELVLVAT